MHAQSSEAAQRQPCYRVYWISQSDRIEAAEIIASHDDSEAIVTARGMIDGRSVELWDRGRFIGRFDPADRTAGEQATKGLVLSGRFVFTHKRAPQSGALPVQGVLQCLQRHNSLHSIYLPVLISRAHSATVSVRTPW